MQYKTKEYNKNTLKINNGLHTVAARQMGTAVWNLSSMRRSEIIVLWESGWQQLFQYMGWGL